MSLSKGGSVQPTEAAEAVLARYLSHGVRSVLEAHGHLLDNGFDPEHVDALIERCKRARVLDDRICALLWAEHWLRSGYGWALIRERLAGKGIGDSDMLYAKERLQSGDEAAAAEAMRRGGLRASDPGRRGYWEKKLHARGFDPDVVQRVLNRFASDEE